MFLFSPSYREYRAYLRQRRRRRAWAAVIMLIALLVAWGAARGGGHHAVRQPTHGTHQTVRVQPSRRSQARETTADAGQGPSWAGFHGIQLPVSAHDGPRERSGGLAAGFADTPRGALLAAINIGVRTAALWGSAIYAPTIRRQVTGADAAALLAADNQSYRALRATAQVRDGQAAGRGYAAETAYRFVSWSPGAATVDVVSAGPGSSGTTVMAVTRLQVLWLRGDWRLVAPPGGNWANSAAPVSSLTGYRTFPNEG